MDGLAVPERIIDRRLLVADLDRIAAGADGPAKRALLLARLRQALADGRAEIARRFEAGAGGAATVAATSYLMDQILRLIGDFAAERAFPVATPTTGEELAIVAVGGYGRGELAPHSDIDLIFLTPDKETPRVEQLVEFVLYMLWDLQLKVGHSTLSIDGLLRLAKADHRVRTAVLEARHVWGHHRHYVVARQRFAAEIVPGSERAFIEAKLAERDLRHRRLGDSRYLMEPNIKDGKGGLRDLNTLFWIAKYLFRVERVADLVQHGVLGPDEARRFAKAQAFLWSLRCHLHTVTGRAEDRLTFDVQPSIARRMGYRDRATGSAVQRFMKHYFLIAKTTGELTRVFCAALAADYMGLGRLGRRSDIVLPPGFGLADDRLTLADESLVARAPVEIMRLFWLAHTNGLDIHPNTLRLVARNLGRLRLVREDGEANRLFLDILTGRNRPDEGLRRLNEAGVLGRFVPEFGRIVAQTQYDMYHVFTTDEHTLHAIGILAGIEAGEFAADHPMSTREIHNVESRRALYVALLLHDVAKGRGGRHADIGEAIARRLGPRFGLSEAETDTVAWLVRHHLVMSDTAFRRDMRDAKTLADFVATVQSPERLRLLLVMTVADIRAVGPSVWNSWKATLLRELFDRALAAMTGGLAPAGAAQARWQDAAVAALRRELADWTDAAFEDHLAKAPASYWAGMDVHLHASTARLMGEADAAGRPSEVATRVDAGRGATEVVVYAADRAGLFSDIAGAMAASGANIVDARIFTTRHGKALDTFWVQDEWGGPFASQAQLALLQRQILHAAIHGMGDFEVTTARRFASTRSQAFVIPVRVLLDNDASAATTLIEVNCRDRPGVLYAITRAIRDLKLQIASAKVSTYGEQVVDVFYVRDAAGLKVTNVRRLTRIRNQLLQAVGGAADAAPAAGEPARPLAATARRA